MIYAWNWVYESCNDTKIGVVDTTKITDPKVRQHLEKAKPNEWLDIGGFDTEDIWDALEEGGLRTPCQIDFICTLYYPG